MADEQIVERLKYTRSHVLGEDQGGLGEVWVAVQDVSDGSGPVGYDLHVALEVLERVFVGFAEYRDSD